MISNEIKDRALQLYKEGLSFKMAGSKFGISKEIVRKYAAERGIIARDHSRCSQKYRLDEDFFESIDTEEKAYFLGFIYADGSIYQKRNSIVLSLKEDDKLILEKLNIAIGSTRPLKYRVRNISWKGSKKGSKNSWVLSLSNKKMCEDLKKVGCDDHKTYTCRFPIIDKSIVHHFMRGYFDGDGCISSYLNKDCVTPSYKFHLAGNEEFLKEYQKIMIEQLQLNQTKLVTQSNIHCLHYGGNKVIRKIREWLYKDATIYLDRKYNKFKTLN